ncbi:TPA: FRG domain-containing protein [Serratia marcescens]
MKSQTAKNFSEFVDIVERLGNDSELMLFRGQAEKGNLLPSIARKNPKTDSTSAEQELIKELKRMGASILPKNDLDDWDLLVIAQHFGMKTRLLD